MTSAPCPPACLPSAGVAGVTRNSRQELEAAQEKSNAYLNRCLPSAPLEHLPQGSASCIGWALLHQLTLKKTPHSYAHKPLFPDVSMMTKIICHTPKRFQLVSRTSLSCSKVQSTGLLHDPLSPLTTHLQASPACDNPIIPPDSVPFSPCHNPYHVLSHHTICLEPTEEFYPTVPLT